MQQTTTTEMSYYKIGIKKSPFIRTVGEK